MSYQHKDNPEDILWSAEKIGNALGMTEKATQVALRRGQIPGRKVGKTWAASRKALRQFFHVTEEASA
jgi:hypothetical protein